jgi:hypothetical protein
LTKNHLALQVGGCSGVASRSSLKKETLKNQTPSLGNQTETTMVCPCQKDASGENTKINYGMDTRGEKKNRTSKKDVDGMSTRSHNSEKLRKYQ